MTLNPALAPALHPEVAAHLERLSQTRFGDMHTFPPAIVREGMRRMTPMQGPPALVHEVENRTIATDAGPLPVRIYRPSTEPQLPVMVFFHGGGFVLGDLDTHDGLARALTVATQCLVVSVEYPLAPEHKFPAAPKAAYAATAWVAEHAAELGGDATKLVVAGDSAGGNLAAVVSLMARDAQGPAIAFQLLIYPDLDFRRTNVSIQAFAGQYGNVSRESQHWFMDHYLSSEAEKLDARVSPLLAANHAGLPPAFIVTAEFDALRDEGEAYGECLKRAGVDATVIRYPGAIHEFMRWPFELARQALRDTARVVRTALGPP